MIRRIRNILKKFVRGYRVTSKSYIEHLRTVGVEIGEGVVLFNPEAMHIDEQNPCLLTIGNYVQMTGPVTILTHDYSWSVIKGMDGSIVGNQRPVRIGNNIFIGWGATILSGSVIEDNVIIGAQSVVAGKCEANSVYAGIPAKRICSIEDYMKKRRACQEEEAILLAKNYYTHYKELPKCELFHEYFFLFTRPDSKEEKLFSTKMKLMGTENMSKEYIRKYRSKYDGFQEFIDVALPQNER